MSLSTVVAEIAAAAPTPAPTPAPAPGGIGDLTPVTDWLNGNVVKLVLIIVALTIMWLARKRDSRGAITMIGIVIVGLLALGLSTGNHAQSVGAWLGNLVFG